MARSYKLQTKAGAPCLTISGHYLTKEFGLEYGDRVQLLKGRNMLIFTKVPKAEVEYQLNLERLKVCEQEAEHLRSVLDALA